MTPERTRAPTSTFKPPYATSSTLAPAEPTSSHPRGTTRPQGRTSASASRPPSHLCQRRREGHQHWKCPAPARELLDISADRADQGMPAQRPAQAHQRVGERDDCGRVRNGAHRRPTGSSRRRLPILNPGSALMLQYRRPDIGSRSPQKSHERVPSAARSPAGHHRPTPAHRRDRALLNRVRALATRRSSGSARWRVHRHSTAWPAQNGGSARVIREPVDHPAHHPAASRARAACSARPECRIPRLQCHP